MMTGNPGHTQFFGLLRNVHRSVVFDRRARVLAESLAAKLPPHASLLDIGCGDGTISSQILAAMPTLTVQGLETAERPACRIPCRSFDGAHIPFPSDSFDFCMFVDVLHHTNCISDVVAEAARVSRRFLLIKDHLAERAFDFRILQFMDWVGNRPHGVVLPYNYQSKAQWMAIFEASGLRVVSWECDLGLYPRPFNKVFGRGLHFLAVLEKKQSSRS